MTQPKDFPVESNWRAIFRDLGIREAVVLRKAGLPEDLLSRTNARIDTPAYFGLWHALEDEVGDPLLPLKLAAAATTEVFSPPFFAAFCSPNMLVAMKRLSHYKRLIAPMRLDLAIDGASATMSFHWLDARVVAPPSLVATELALMVQLFRRATREHLQPTKVVSSANITPAAPYEDFFGCRVVQGEAPALTFRRSDAEQPFLTANEGMWRAFEPDLRRRLAELDEAASMEDRVRATLLEALPSGRSSMDAVASRLAMSKRTLQRRLSGEGTSFQKLLNRTREDLARHYLAHTALSSTEISFLLGYEEPNSFFRAFQEWTGNSPERMRRAMAG